MTKNEFLEKYDFWESVNKKDIDEYKSKSNKLLTEFLLRFDIKSLINIKIEDYVVGNKTNNSFCWWVETKLRDFGDIRGGQLTAFQRFGIYYDKNNKNYVFKNKRTKQTRFGSTENEVFNNIKSELINLIKDTQNDNYIGIEANKLNPLFKNKISYLYSNERQLPIYSDKDLNILLTIFEIPFDIKEDRIYKRKKLFDYYRSLNRTDISPITFMKFVYSDLGYRSYLRTDNANNLSKKIIIKKYQVVDIKNTFEITSTRSYTRKGLIIEKPETIVQKKITGKKGEEIVKSYLLTHKKELGIIGNIECACEVDDYKHYDFSYRTTDGNTIYIEVKATKNDTKEAIVFEMSDSEYAFMNNNIENYFIYYINDVFNCNIIKRIPAKLIKVSPSKYRAYFTGNS